MEANFYALLNSLPRMFVMLAATWRMVSLICNEEGPFAIFEKNRNLFRHLHKTRAWFRATKLYSGIRCEWCTSIWVAFPFLALYLYFPTETLVYATALTFSTGTIFWKYIVQTLNAVKEQQEQLTSHLKYIESEQDNIFLDRIAALEEELATIDGAISDARLQGADVPETIYVRKGMI